MAVQIDALRVATDPTFAASLTQDQWNELAQHPDWMRLVAGQSGVVAASIAAAGDKFMQQAQPPTPASVLNGPYTIVGSKVPRLQGMGIVNGFAQYTEHMNFSGMLYTRTLRSP